VWRNVQQNLIHLALWTGFVCTPGSHILHIFIYCTILPFTHSKSRLSHRSIVNAFILLILQSLAIMENVWPWHSLTANIHPLRTEVPPLASCSSGVLRVSPLYMTGKPWEFGLSLCVLPLSIPRYGYGFSYMLCYSLWIVGFPSHLTRGANVKH
jgi:hypothetical protein